MDYSNISSYITQHHQKRPNEEIVFLKMVEFAHSVEGIYRYIQVHVPQNTTQFSIIHIFCHKHISWTIIGFWKGFTCSFSSCVVLRLARFSIF